ncbi:MAG: anthranilate synthase component I family protein [Planctomycetes bacterium]|nr:anthranilate synthase component I family protein [Planctomycetota bacterium]MCC7169432.1 anthranilate synthase component I family protein [Planctomycetota bacterium]
MTELRLHQRRLRDDLDPFEVFSRLKRGRPGVLLDGDRTSLGARHALALFQPRSIVRVEAGADRRGERPLERLAAALSSPRVVDGARPGRFCGGHAGFVSYDVGRTLEHVPDTAAIASAAPDLWFAHFDRFVEFDFESGAVLAGFVEGASPGAGSPSDVLDDIERALDAPAEPVGTFTTGAVLRSNFDPSSYRRAVDAVREHIRLGEVYQVNLAQRFQTEFHGSAAALYARLRVANPAPYAAYVDTGDVALSCSSPESFLSRVGDAVTTRPIKGTRRRSGDAVVDALAVEQLCASSKERSELNMIVDLLRNDLGRVARIGSVEVVDAGAIETFATVIHRVATIRATLRPGTSSVDLLAATFPGGSITGAPKIAALRVIEALEGVRRGVFCGSIGWIAQSGDLALNIAIRTLVVESGRAHFHVGGGVVYDSDPQAEYDETLAKGAALARALGLPLS